MSVLSDFLEFLKSLMFINDTLKDIKAGNVERDATIRLVTEKTIDLDKRISNLETARASDLAQIQAAIAQLAAERSQLKADVEFHIARMQRETPQLPPAQPTDN